MGHATVFTLRPDETSSCQTSFSGHRSTEAYDVTIMKGNAALPRACLWLRQATGNCKVVGSVRCYAEGGRVTHQMIAYHQALRGRLAGRLGSLAAILAASSTPSQLNAFCLLFDSSDRMSKPLAWKGELVLANCSKHGPACDVTRNDVLDLIFGWIEAGCIRSLAIDWADGAFHIAWDNKLLQNTCRILRSALANRTPFIRAQQAAAMDHVLQSRSF